MSLIYFFIELVVLAFLVLIGCFIVDETFTGRALRLAWIAKLVIGILAIFLVVASLHSYPTLGLGL
jgi:hypothetical protein